MAGFEEEFEKIYIRYFLFSPSLPLLREIFDKVPAYLYT